MSKSLLMRWFNYLLFGNNHEPLLPTPSELHDTLLRIECEHISWPHIIEQGGFTAFPYHVHGDLNALIDYVEKKWLDEDLSITDPGPFRTRAVSRFWNQLQVLLARYFSTPSPETLVPSPEGDDAILKELLITPPGHQRDAYDYDSPSFWGRIARRFLNTRRPLKDFMPAAVMPPSDVAEKTAFLYHVTCESRGDQWDPLSMVMVPRHHYLNPVHWQSDALLKSFMVHHPTHALTTSIQNVLKQSINEIMHGETPSAMLETCPRLQSILDNVHIIHTTIPKVPFRNEPPKLVDVFQRLLALCHRDGLWEEHRSPAAPPLTTEWKGTDIFQIIEHSKIVERENRLLWKHINAKDTVEYGPLHPEHTCVDLYATDKAAATTAV